LPSRRSVDNQRGALVITFDGQVRSGSSIGVKGRYRWNRIGLGCWTGTDWILVPNDVVALAAGLDVLISDMGFLAVGYGADRKRVRLRSEDAGP